MDPTPLWLSLRIATIATAIAFVLGTAIAYWRQGYQGRWRSLIDSLLLAPMVLPPTVLGFGLLLLLGKNGPLGRLGLNIVFTSSAAVLTATVVGLPLMYKTLLGAFRQIDPELPQVARTLGAGEWRILGRIILPLARPGIFSGIILTFARALGEFGATLMLAGNIPGKTQTLPMAIYFAVEAGAFREAAFWSGIILLITLGGLSIINHASNWSIVFKSLDPSHKVHPRSYPIGVSLKPAPTVDFAPQLSVDIQKQLPGFTLQVELTSDRQPLGLLGASGAGKSLVLRCLAGLETPDAGRIVINGRVLFDAEAGINLPSRERRVGLLWQNYALFPHLTVAENVAFGLPVGLSRFQRHQQVMQQLAMVQLLEWRDRYPHQLSGGQQQRVALARVLASQPALLLLDEPFSALDTHLRDQMERDLQWHLDQFSGITLLVSHNIDVTYRLCSRLLVMVQGQAAVCAAKQTVIERPPTVSAAQLTGCQNITPIIRLNPKTVNALAWHCTLQTAQSLDTAVTHLGLRAEQIRFIDHFSDQTQVDASFEAEAQGISETLTSDSSLAPQLLNPFDRVNVFPCWLVMTSETPHCITLYLKLHTEPENPQDYHLQAEVTKKKWQLLQNFPLPWSIQLRPEQLLMLRD
ncbi:MAG: molybdate ABC transporter permease subunit [Spirulina sp. SIO3F2]|nr:molybdate ABC transporter permease subunit [Spirulina sp. SIO3F2]